MKVKRLPASVITTLGIGGTHEVLFPESLEEIEKIVENYGKEGTYVLGGGSNLVISENCGKKFVSLEKFKKFKIEEDRLTLGAGVLLKKVIKEQLKRGFSLFEALAGIRATVGGVIAQNAGAYGFSTKERLLEVKYYDFKEKEVKVLKNFSSFSYRNSPFPQIGIILEATFKIERDSKVKEKIKNYILKRLSFQPPFYLKTAGSTFKNPPPPYPPAGKLLDEAGLKGFSIGKLKLSEKHANFLINCGGATFSEFQEITEIAREKVKREFGIELELEVKVAK